MKQLIKYTFLLIVGGSIYYAIEVLFRGYSHPAMFFVGGIAFIACGLTNEVLEWDHPVYLQMLLCAFNITCIEFVSGCILNLVLGLHIWDYSYMPYNVLGQICLPFTIAWYLLSLVAIVLDDYLRYWFFGEEKPRYVWR